MNSYPLCTWPEWLLLHQTLGVKADKKNAYQAANAALYRFFYRCPGNYRTFNWHQIPDEFGVNPKTAHRYYLKWTESGDFEKFWDSFHLLRKPIPSLPKADKKTLSKMSPLRAFIAELERAYQYFNHSLVGGLLPSYTPISIDGEHNRQLRGYLQPNVWYCEKTHLYHIALMPKSLQSWPQALAVLLHEMAHLRNLVAGFDDTDPRTQYHTIDFRESARLLGLRCIQTNCGYSETHLTPRAQKVIEIIKPAEELINRLHSVR